MHSQPHQRGADNRPMELDPRVRRRYEIGEENDRLTRLGRGELIRHRTWDIFERLMPGKGKVADVGGGPGNMLLILRPAATTSRWWIPSVVTSSKPGNDPRAAPDSVFLKATLATSI